MFIYLLSKINIDSFELIGGGGLSRLFDLIGFDSIFYHIWMIDIDVNINIINKLIINWIDNIIIYFKY